MDTDGIRSTVICNSLAHTMDEGRMQLMPNAGSVDKL